MLRAAGVVAETAVTLALAWLLNAATREPGVQIQTADGLLAGVSEINYFRKSNSRWERLVHSSTLSLQSVADKGPDSFGKRFRRWSARP
jgi:hypothetical protein